MPNLRCPRCRTVSTFEAGQDPVCPRCGYGADAPEPERSEAASAPSGAATPATPTRPAYGQGARTDGGAVAALVLGIVGLVAVPLVPSIIAWVLGTQSMQRIDEDPRLDGRGMAQAGLILGIIGTAFWALFILFYVFVIVAVFSSF